MIDFDIESLVNINEKTKSKLYNEYYYLVYNICQKYLYNSEESKDLSHEVFIKVFKNLNKLNLVSSAQLTSWIKVIAKHSAIDYIRLKQLKTVDDKVIDIKGDEIDLSFLDKGYNFSDFINDKINLLSPRYKSIVKMFYFEDKTHEEIAQELEINVGTSKSNLHKAKLRLADLLKNYKNEI